MIARQRGAALVVLVLAMGTVATAADLRPSWECLPSDTAVMVRLPQPARFVETLKTRTKFGSVALGPKRVEGLWQLLAGRQATEGEWSLEEFEQTLAGYGLETGEFAAVMDGDLGGGLVIRQRDGLPPLQMLLGWLEPGEESARGGSMTAKPGFGPRAQLIARYSAVVGGIDETKLQYFIALNHWKSACIVHGVYTRYKRGQKSSVGVDMQGFVDAARRSLELAETSVAKLGL